MRTATGATAAAAATGTAAAQEGTPTASGTATGTGTANGTESGTESAGGGGGGPPDFGDWFSNVGNFGGSTTDARGQDTVTVTVGAEGNGGAFAFDPPAIHVDNGATVEFEWTGNGGGHNVVSDGEGPLDSDTYTASGVNYEQTFESDGIYNYYCGPHQGQGMKGSVVVGTDYPTASQGGAGGGGGPLGVPGSAKMLGVATSVVMVATLGMAYVFMRYGGDYETPGDE